MVEIKCKIGTTHSNPNFIDSVPPIHLTKYYRVTQRVFDKSPGTRRERSMPHPLPLAMGLDLAIESKRSGKPVLSPILFLISLADH